MTGQKPDTSVDWIWKKSKQDVGDFLTEQKNALRALEEMQRNRPLKPPGKDKR